MTVVVSRGQRPVEIPDFAGTSAERAQSKLAELGFEVSVTEENSDTVDKGVVIDQTPDDGTGFKGDQIELVVSKGPVMVVVPDLARDERRVGDRRSWPRSVSASTSARPVSTSAWTPWSSRTPTAATSLPKGSVVTVGVV